MTVRDSMVDLISRMREIISNDDINASITDEQLQRYLDSHREHFTKLELTGNEQIDGSYSDEWIADEVRWDKSAIISDKNNIIVVPEYADEIIGYWKTSIGYPELYVTGWVYDIFNAAADVIEQYSGQMADYFDFSADGASFNLSQKRANFTKMVSDLRARGKIKTVRQVRNDAIE